MNNTSTIRTQKALINKHASSILDNPNFSWNTIDEELLRLEKQTEYTREEFLDTYDECVIEMFGLKFPEAQVLQRLIDDNELKDVEDLDISNGFELAEIQGEFYYQFFIQHLESNLWGRNDEEKHTLETILSYWEYVV